MAPSGLGETVGGEGIFPAEWVENIPAWLRIVMLVIAFPVVTVVVFLLFGYLSALLYSPLFLVRWLWRRRAQVEKPERGRGRGCLMWVVYLLGIGALGLVVLVGINLTSPAVDPCPTNSPDIPPPGPDACDPRCVLGRVHKRYRRGGVARRWRAGRGDRPGRVRAACEGPWTGRGSSSRFPCPAGSELPAASGRMRTGGTWSITEWTAGGGVISKRTFQGTSSRPRSAHFVRKATTTTAMSNYEERP